MFVVWFTGPSGSGKTTVSHALAKKLRNEGLKVEILDGDIIRKSLYPHLGFSEEARKTHNRVVIHMAKLLSRNGVIALVSLISPYKSVREFARKEIGNFLEVYMRCSLEERIRRDPKGLYAKALRGEIKNLTGYDGVYEEPESPEVILDTDKMPVDVCVEHLMNEIKKRYDLDEIKKDP